MVRQTACKQNLNLNLARFKEIDIEISVCRVTCKNSVRLREGRIENVGAAEVDEVVRKIRNFPVREHGGYGLWDFERVRMSEGGRTNAKPTVPGG